MTLSSPLGAGAPVLTCDLGGTGITGALIDGNGRLLGHSIVDPTGLPSSLVKKIG